MNQQLDRAQFDALLILAKGVMTLPPDLLNQLVACGYAEQKMGEIVITSKGHARLIHGG